MAADGSPRSAGDNGLPAAAPVEICGYPIDSPLDSPGSETPSFLAVGPGGRGVVLKGLDRDCLLPKGLHPSIRDRLARVRELALAGVANLYGVERDAQHPHRGFEAWLMWEYVPGATFDEFADAPGRSARELAMTARELVLTVDSLHMQGIVHGSIKGGNVIVAPAGTVRLTHVSPLLYTDPAEDAHAVIDMLSAAVRRRGEEGSPLGQAVLAVTDGTTGAGGSRDDPPADAAAMLRRLGARLATLAESRDSDPPAAIAAQHDPRESRPRRRALMAAVIVTLIAFAAALYTYFAVGHPSLPLPKAVHDSIDARMGR